MAKFMVKKSELKNICKAVDDRKLAELKKEIIEILKKQDEKEFKKAVDYLESQELHYTHLEKSFTGKWVEKAGYGIGTVRVWKGKKYKKIAPGKWARVFEKEGRGTNIAIGKLIAKVQKIDNVEDLMAFVMANKQRFVDENGVDLPVLDKLRTAVDARNNNVSASEKKLIKTKDFKKDAAKYKGKTITYKGKSYEIGDYEPGDMNILPRVWLTRYGDKKSSLDKETFYELLEGSKTVSKPAENTSKGSVSQKEIDQAVKFARFFKEKNGRRGGFTVTERDLSNSEKEMRDYIKQYSSGAELGTGKYVDTMELAYAITHPEYMIENMGDASVEFLIDNKILPKSRFDKMYFSDNEESENEKPAEKYDAKAYEEEKDNVLRHTNKDFDSVDAAIIDLNRHKNWINRKSSDETEHEKNVRESRLKAVDDIIEGLKNGDRKLLDKFVKEEESEAEKPLKTTKSPFKVFADKEPVGTFEKYGDNAVMMDATKEQKALFDSLNKAVSKDTTRPHMTDCYYDGENIISTDGRRLVCIKAGDIGIEPGYVKVNSDGNKIKLERFVKDTNHIDFPNYKRVMPENNKQQVSLDSKRLKEKLKEMKKDGAYDETGRVAFEFKDGKVILDGTAVGQSDAKLDGFDFIMLNAGHLTDAIINNDGQTMFISDNPMKAVSISDGSSDIVMMPMNHEGSLPDYAENRAKKNAEREKKNSAKQNKINKNKQFIEEMEKTGKIDNLLNSVSAGIDERVRTWSDDELKRAYEKFGLNFNKLLEKDTISIDSVVDKKTNTTLKVAYLHEKLKEKYPEVKEKIAAELEKRGISVKKSLFDDFITDMLVDEVIEDEEEDEENETEYNDYSAEQPELFNSTEFLVREALNRRFNCVM